MKKAFIITVLLIITRTIGFTQSVGIGTTAPDASAVLELKATNKGFLPPRMTASEKGLIPSPKAGLMIYQTDATIGLYIYNGTTWTAVAGTSTGFSWALNGNSGTTASNFIGTRDEQPLRFRVNNLPAGEINATTANIALGVASLASNTTGELNISMGLNTLNKNTTGNGNTAIGVATLFSNLEGNENAALGLSALALNTLGNNNVATGAYALTNSLTGNNNVATGNKAMFNNQTGNSNTAVGSHASFTSTAGNSTVAVGDSALYKNSANENVAIGSRALRNNSSGSNNVAVGSYTLYNNSIGSQNTAIGRIALFDNISGQQNTALGNSASRYNQMGSGNVAVGFQSLFNNVANNNNTAVGNGSLANTIANDNTAVGYDALNDNTSGFSNTAVGFNALGANALGFSNTAVGRNALSANFSGSYNTAIGHDADISGGNFVNATAIGARSRVGCSNCLVLGSITGYNGATANSNVGIGTITPQKTLHVNPNGNGGILIGDNPTTGGYTMLNMGISQASNGYSYIQSTKSSGTAYGNLALNASGGFVGIGTSTPLSALHIKQYADQTPSVDAGIRLERAANTSHWDMGIDGFGDLSYAYNLSTRFYFDNVDGSLVTVSDQRMKKDINNVGNVLASIMKLEAKSYRYIDNEKDARLSYGFVAQEVEKIFPDFVSTKGTDNKKAVAYQKIGIMAVKAIQEQQAIIEAQNKRIEKLEQQMELLLKK